MFQKKENPIPRVSDIEVFRPGASFDDLVEESELKKVLVADFAYSIDRSNNFMSRVVRFLLAENEAGRQASVIKDFALIFLPFGQQVHTVADFIVAKIKQNQTKVNKMPESENKPWYKSKTINAAIVVIVIVATNFFGIEITEAELQDTVSAIASAVAGVVAIWGRISAKQAIDTSKE